ncbi:DUF2199 domain-containing protein [Dactylosporangium sp. NPDC049525]|uniref:DUF2199 domain-containing protein n=1 Tax=Dactylosporangium sp. NPDC049525 TaxID=3154730 RepID=UPI003439F6EC
MTDHGFLCRCCGERHGGLPFAYGPEAPEPWHDSLAGDASSALEQDYCIIQAEHFFMRGRLVIPVHDADQDFAWTVWVSLSRQSFSRSLDLWTTPGREQEPPYFGWLCTELPVYPVTTLHLKTHVHTQPVGSRPLIELEATDHPLAVEQRTGITVDRVQQFAELLLHPSN